MISKKILFHDIGFKANFPVQELLEFHMERKINDHVKVSIKCILKDVKDENDISMAIREITVYLKNEKEDILFQGDIVDFYIHCDGGLFIMELEALSKTYLLDLDEKCRSFQYGEQTYFEAVREILEAENANGLDRSKKEKTNKLKLQYKETDWDFIKRMASKTKDVIVADNQGAIPRLYYGFPFSSSYHVVDEINFRKSKSIRDMAYYEDNYNIKLPPSEYIVIRFESQALYEMGEGIQFNGILFYVVEIQYTLKHEGLVMYYTLKRRDYIFQVEILNPMLKGLELTGTVLAVQKDEVKLHLQIDRSQNMEQAQWFTYGTSYTSLREPGFYFMPQVGNTVKLYIQGKMEETAIAIQSSRKDGSYNPKTQDPNVKVIGSIHGHELQLDSHSVTTSAFGSRMVINLDDDGGISITSDGDISIVAPEGKNGGADLAIYGKNISMSAGGEITAQCGAGSMILNEDVHWYGNNIYFEPVTKSPNIGLMSFDPRKAVITADLNGFYMPEEIIELNSADASIDFVQEGNHLIYSDNPETCSVEYIGEIGFSIAADLEAGEIYSAEYYCRVQNSNTTAYMGLVIENMGEEQGAIELYAQAVEISPGTGMITAKNASEMNYRFYTALEQNHASTVAINPGEVYVFAAGKATKIDSGIVTNNGRAKFKCLHGDLVCKVFFAMDKAVTDNCRKFGTNKALTPDECSTFAKEMKSKLKSMKRVKQEGASFVTAFFDYDTLEGNATVGEGSVMCLPSIRDYFTLNNNEATSVISEMTIPYTYGEANDTVPWGGEVYPRMVDGVQMKAKEEGNDKGVFCNYGMLYDITLNGNLTPDHMLRIYHPFTWAQHIIKTRGYWEKTSLIEPNSGQVLTYPLSEKKFQYVFCGGNTSNVHFEIVDTTKVVIQMMPGAKMIKIDRHEYTLQEAVYLERGRTMGPLYAIAEAFLGVGCIRIGGGEIKIHNNRTNTVGNISGNKYYINGEEVPESIDGSYPPMAYMPLRTEMDTNNPEGISQVKQEQYYVPVRFLADVLGLEPIYEDVEVLKFTEKKREFTLDGKDLAFESEHVAEIDTGTKVDLLVPARSVLEQVIGWDDFIIDWDIDNEIMTINSKKYNIDAIFSTKEKQYQLNGQWKKAPCLPRLIKDRVYVSAVVLFEELFHYRVDRNWFANSSLNVYDETETTKMIVLKY